MPRIQSALIVGGGIGGQAAAIGLRKSGIRVEIVEIKEQWSVYHVGIIAQSNMVRALVTLGVADKCVAAGFPYRGLKFCDANGNVMSESPDIRLAGPGYPAFLGLTRPALHDVLSEAALDAGATVRLGVTVSEISQSASSADVKFTDGSRGEFDFIIGADGVHSSIRAMVFGKDLEPKFTGQGVWRYNVPRPKDMDYGLIYSSAAGPKAGFIPLTSETAYLFRIGSEPRNPRFRHEELADLMRERLAPFGGLIGQLREKITDPELVVYRPLETLPVSRSWYRGRVLLIGDAAHPITPHLGQGAAQAVEDSVVLAELLPQDRPLPELLEAFMLRRYERCKLIVESSLQIGEWEQHPDPNANVGALMARVGQAVAQPV
jgi:2-polyprenyl-6-methoxyphenol hydroxylase-like FAD-dependent oxidoreductase